MSARVGIGVDAHRFGGPGPLVLGGVRVVHDVGLAGHSDGDVLAHAVSDALLGAAGLGDLGEVFGSDAPEHAGADSMRLLARCVELAGRPAQWVDATLVAEQPRLAPYRAEMARALSSVVGCPVNVKVTSTDGLGFTGRGEGMAALAVVLLE